MKAPIYRVKLDSKQTQAEEPIIQIGEYAIPLKEVIHRGSMPSRLTYRSECIEGAYILTEEEAIDIIIDYVRKLNSKELQEIKTSNERGLGQIIKEHQDRIDVLMKKFEEGCIIKSGRVPQEWLDKLHASILNNGIFRIEESTESDKSWIIFTSGGIKKEGMPHPTNSFFPTASEAWEAYCEKLILFLQAISFLDVYLVRILIWRSSPELHYNEEKCLWSVYSRLLISHINN